MDLRHRDFNTVDNALMWTVLGSVVLVLLGLGLCFVGQPNQYRWLILVPVGGVYLLMSAYVSGNFGSGLQELRKKAREEDEERRKMTRRLDLFQRYVESFPDQNKVGERLQDAGGAVRAAFLAEAHLIEHGLKRSGTCKYDPDSLRESEKQFREALRKAGDNISDAQAVLFRLHECAKEVAHPAQGVLDTTEEYVWPEWAKKSE